MAEFTLRIDGMHCGSCIKRVSQALASVEAPTLLIVGGADPPVLDLNQQALGSMHCERALKVVPGATHLFEEPGALKKVAELARDWFATYLSH